LASEAPDAAQSSRSFDHLLASTIVLFGFILAISLWLSSVGILSGSGAFGFIIVSAGIVALLVWAALLSRIRFRRI